ncbi:acyltransferase family protein [Tabrizicola sp. BL-A-41-H6]|uniref:acyltransferase family protein n=1 Tax=Tabrizicola sp. BL-A-41-H6 TaxID=3421107 RepID=UPI003D666BD9
MQAESYRPDIDGLRALAVLPVIFYHLSSGLVPGGYLGVDVFFVISGYLIAGILLSDLGQSRFSLLRFYERRARRILPALFVVIAACVLPAAAFMLPGQHADFGVAVLAALGFVSNLHYYSSTGYFMASAEVKPLLHTWSLAVEEQFYLLFPLLLFAAWRWARGALPVVIGVVGLASLGTAVWQLQRDPAAAFYLLPSRAWELMAGAMVAVVARAPSRLQAEVAGLAGLALIGASYAFPDALTVFGLAALAPVLGASLFIWSGGGTVAARLASSSPLRRIGLISFSAYLWHWPLLAFWRLRGGGDVTLSSGLMMLVATLALATLTYQFVERPFRDRSAKARFPNRALVPFLGSAALCLTLFGVMPLLPGAGGGSREAAAIEAKLATNYGLGQVCETAFTLDPTCRTSDKPETLLWGDSYAMHLAPAILGSGGWGGLIQMTKSSCAPVLGLSIAPVDYEADWYKGCLRFNEEVFAWLAGAPSIQVVVLSSNLRIIANDLRRPDGTVVPIAEAEAAARVALLETVDRIRALGKEVVMVSPTPATGEDIGQCLAAALLADGPENACDFPLSKTPEINQKAIRFLRNLQGTIPLIDLSALICPAGICQTRHGDVFVYRDPGHLSIEGSEWLGRTYRFDRLIRQTAAGETVEIN